MQAASLPASAGWQWIRDGYRLFLKQPLAVFAWAMSISLLVLFAMLAPPIGPLLFVMLMPIVTLMTLSACKHIEAGRIMLPSMWIKPLKQPGVFRRLFWMGAAYGITSLAAGILSFLPFALDLNEAMQTAAASGDITPFVMAMRAPFIIFGLAYTVIAALFWHAPVLVAWHGLKLTQALFFSGVACWRNKLPFLVYGFAWVFIFLGIDLCSGILVWLGLSAKLANTLQVPFNIAAGGVLYCSFYPAYSTVFQTGMLVETATGTLDAK